MYDARDIANIVLDLADERNVSVSNLSLQKLLYFIHGWFFASYDKPLIKNKFEAWQYGPVQRALYEQFKVFRGSPISGARATYIDPLTGNDITKPAVIRDDHRAFIQAIFEKYADHTASQLVNESHVEDGPWEYVWQQAEDIIYPGMKIPDSLIVDHFSRIAPILTFH